MICCRSYQDIPEDPRDRNVGPDIDIEEDEDVETEEETM